MMGSKAKTFIGPGLLALLLFVSACTYQIKDTDKVVATMIQGFFAGITEIAVGKWPDFKTDFESVSAIADNFTTAENVDITSVGNGVIILIEAINYRLAIYPDSDVLTMLRNYLPVIQTVVKNLTDKDFGIKNPELARLYAKAIRDGINQGLASAKPTIKEKAPIDEYNDWIKKWKGIGKK